MNRYQLQHDTENWFHTWLLDSGFIFIRYNRRRIRNAIYYSFNNWIKTRRVSMIEMKLYRL